LVPVRRRRSGDWKSGPAHGAGQTARASDFDLSPRLAYPKELMKMAQRVMTIRADHLLHAFRYVTMNPVRARLAAEAEDWRWSSAAAHLCGKSDGLTKIVPALSRIANFRAFVETAEGDHYLARLRLSETTRRPAGQKAWVQALEAETGRLLWPQKPGRKSNA
jgi:putative transposase